MFLLTTVNLIAHVWTVWSVVTEKIPRYARSGSAAELVGRAGYRRAGLHYRQQQQSVVTRYTIFFHIITQTRNNLFKKKKHHWQTCSTHV